MKITKNTTIVDLYCNDIIDADHYEKYQWEDLLTVEAIIARANDIDYWNNSKTRTKALISFLKEIVGFQEKIEAGTKPNEALLDMPNTLRFTLSSVYSKEKQRFGAEYVFEIMLGGQATFFHSLLSDALALLSDQYFNDHSKSDRYLSDNNEFEKERYKYALISLIVNLGEALGNYLDSEYYALLIKSIINECGISEELIKKTNNYANVLNLERSTTDYYEKSNEIIQINHGGETYLGDFQTKYNDLISELSVRTRNVILTNIKDYRDILPWVNGEKTKFNFKNCGKKTIAELLWLISEFGNYYYLNKDANNNSGEKQYNIITIQALNYLLDLEMGKTNLYGKDVNDVIRMAYPDVDLLSKDIVSDPSQIYSRIKNQSIKHTYDCLMLLIQVFSNIILLIRENKTYLLYIPLFSSAVNMLKFILDKHKSELEYYKYITDDKETLITNEFQRMLSTTNVQCKNAIINNNLDYKEFLKYSSKDYNFRNLRQVGRKCAEELELLLSVFSEKYDKILKTEQCNVRIGKIIDLFPFLSDSDAIFVHNFESLHHHYPIIYILHRYFKTTDNYYAKIFASYCGLVSDSQFSLSSIAHHYNLTRERIRQILINKRFLSDKFFQDLMKQDWGDYYLLKDKDYLSVKDTNYKTICSEEQVDISFFSYCSLLSIISNVKLLNVSETGRWLSSNEIGQLQFEGKQFLTYMYDSKFYHFRFAIALTEVNRLINLQRNDTIRIPLYSYFISNEDYWTNDVYLNNETVLKSLLKFLEKVLLDTYGDCIENNNLVLDANKLNYAEIMYNILKDHGKSMHLQEIFKRFKELYPDSKYEDSKQIKPYLFKDERIECIGRSSIYTLTEWNDYTGSLSELAVNIVSSFEDPVNIDYLVKEMLTYRPSSTERSVQSIINKCIKEGELVSFCGNLLGVPKKEYKEEYIKLPRTFDDWMIAFKNFTINSGCFPIGGSKGLEGSLYNWYYDTRNYINLSPEEIISFHELMQELQQIPHNMSERKFLNNCVAYESFVRQSGRMLSKKDDNSLFMWFRFNITKYMSYEDNRRNYFKELINFLQNELGSV